MLEKTLTEAARAIPYVGGIKTGTGATFRHPVEDLYPEINSAYRELREETIERDMGFYVVESALATLPTARASAQENYSLIDWPLTAQAIVRIDVLVNGYWDKLERVEWENLRQVLPVVTTARSERPTHYSPRDSGTVVAATQTAGKIALAPFCPVGSYKMSTLPHWADISTVTDKFIFPTESAFRWMVWNVVARISCRDKNQGARYTMAVREMERCAEKMGRFATKGVPSGGTMRRARRRWG